MAGHAGDPDVGIRRRLAVDRHGRLRRQAELVVVEPGGNVGMGLRVHVRVDAHGHRGNHPQAPGGGGQVPEFAFRLDVEAPDPGAEGVFQLPVQLADRLSSPPETMSKPDPRRARRFRMARLPLAFTA